MRAILDGALPPPPIAELLGFEILEVEPERALFELRPAEWMYNPIGCVHGGIAATILDTCMGCAIHSTLEAGVAYTTVDLQVRYIRAMTEQTGRVLAAARQAGLPIKLHAEQLSALHGASLAASFGALSADHLEYADEADARAMAAAGTIAVLLPGAFYFMRETKLPPVDLFRAHHVPIAIATDCNPGTSPVLSPTLMLSMACTLFGLTPEEALAGMTVHAAKALGLEKEIGTISTGKAADLCVWRVSRPAELAYWIGLPGPEKRIVAGVDS
jgi:imidazolonepropionase